MSISSFKARHLKPSVPNQQHFPSLLSTCQLGQGEGILKIFLPAVTLTRVFDQTQGESHGVMKASRLVSFVLSFWTLACTFSF